MYRALWYFLIYAFLGWCAEVCFAAANEGKFVNRGFLNGPVCPIYGFGMLLVIHYLTPLQDKPLILFAGSVFLTSLIELVGGWILKKLFHQAWWDYSDVPFNLGGYVCLKFSLLWGLGCMLVMDLVQPLVVTLVGVAVGLAGRVCLATLLLLLGIDAAATVQSIAKLNRQLRQLDDIAAKLKEISNEIGESLWDGASAALEKGEVLKGELAQKKQAAAEEVEEYRARIRTMPGELAGIRREMEEHTQALGQEHREKLEARRIELRARYAQLLDSRFFGQKRLILAFPGMKSTHWHEALEQLQRRISKQKREM